MTNSQSEDVQQMTTSPNKDAQKMPDLKIPRSNTSRKSRKQASM